MTSSRFHPTFRAVQQSPLGYTVVDASLDEQDIDVDVSTISSDDQMKLINAIYQSLSPLSNPKSVLTEERGDIENVIKKLKLSEAVRVDDAQNLVDKICEYYRPNVIYDAYSLLKKLLDEAAAWAIGNMFPATCDESKCSFDGDESIDGLTRITSVFKEFSKSVITLKRTFDRLEREAMRKFNEDALSELAPRMFYAQLIKRFDRKYYEEWFLYSLLQLLKHAKGNTNFQEEMITMLLLLVKQSGKMQVFMDLYVAFTRAIADKCSEEGAIESHPIEYLNMVKEMLMVENELVTKYFDESYRVRLLNTIETSMIRNRAQQLGKAVKVLLANQNKEGLSVLYTHMKACEEGPIMFRNHYRKCLAKMAIQLIQKIQRPSDYFELICDLLALEFEHRAYVDELFDSDTDMHHCVNDAFTEAVCTSGVKIALALVHYTDALLEKKENRPTEPSEEFIAALQNIILFLRHVHERDIFEVKYRKSLLERVISGQCSIDYEHVMAKMLSHEYGNAYTHNITMMLEGFFQSEVIDMSFQEKGPTKLCVFALPSITIDKAWMGDTIKVPDEIQALMNKYEDVYATHGNKKTLKFLPSIGMCQIDVNPTTGDSFTLSMHPSLAVVLLSFNTNDALTFENLRSLTGLSDVSMYDALLSLTNCGILVSDPKDILSTRNPVITDEIVNCTFRYEPNFRAIGDGLKPGGGDHPILIRHFKCRPGLQPSSAEALLVEKCLSRDTVVEYAIARVMKSERKLNLSELHAKVAKAIHDSNLQLDLLNERIRNLIDMDFLKRDPEDPDTFHYIP
ncbi:hypothetical protein ACOME3_002589 [Neoechinorhynchus agilis]